MVVIEPLEYEETTNIDEHNQMVGKINEEIAAINHIEGSTAQAALDAAASAKDAGESASEARTQAFNAARSASEAADDAAKVNQFDSRIGACVNNINTEGSAFGVVIAYSTDEVPLPDVIRVPIPNLDAGHAGVVTPAQMKDIADELDTLGRDLNNVKAEYLDKYNLTAVQLVRSKTDWEKSPTIPTLKANEYALDDGKRALNAKSAGEHPDLVHTTGNQKIEGLKDFRTPAFPRANEFKTAVNIGDLVNLIANIVSPYVFEGKTDAKIASNVSVIGASAFISAKFVGDKTFDLPQLAIIGKYAFAGSDLKKIMIRTNTIMLDFRSFRGCPDLAHVEIVNAVSIPTQCFDICKSLATLIIKGTAVTPLTTIDALTGTPIAQGTGYVYVPDNLVSAYRQATNWITYASQIKPISELPPEVSA